MKNTFKKILSVVCSAALLAGVMTFAPAAALLADGDPIIWGDDDAEKTALPTTSGTYQLCQDITIDHMFVIGSETDGKVSTENIVLDLNGKTIKVSDDVSSRVYCFYTKLNGNKEAGNYGSLTILDSSDSQTGRIVGSNTPLVENNDVWKNDSNQKVNMHGNGGLIYVPRHATLNIQGGLLTNGHAASGQTGANGVGGAIYCQGVLNMSGGKISGCSASSGGAIFIKGTSNTNDCGYVYMSGGEITNNTAESVGGGICAGIDSNKIELSGTAKITGNTCYAAQDYANGHQGVNKGGAGIMMYAGQLILTDKDHAGNDVGCHVQVCDNICDYGDGDARDNVYLSNDKINVQVNGDIADDASIGVCRPATSHTSTLVTGLSDGDGAQFFSDNHDEALVVDSNGNVVLQNNNDPTPYISGYNVNISGVISLIARIEIPSGCDVSDLSVDASYTYVDKNGTTKSKSYSTSANGGLSLTPVSGSGSSYEVSVPVDSSCMTRPVTFSMTYGETQLPTKEMSINSYANALLNNNNVDSSVKTILQKLLIYGLYAQKQFKINDGTDELPTSSNGSYPVSYSESGPQSDIVPTEFTRFSEVADFYGVTVVFLTGNEVKFYFTSEKEFYVKYNANDEWTALSAEASGSYSVYRVKGPGGNGISATAHDTDFYIKIDGVEYTYAIDDYLKSIVYKDSTSQNMKNLAKAYYNFAESL
ncbi:MAG: hypothetical protein J5379_09980 [Clostridiales bacterium]|nr:hypothetical protein [Clostridiales bacterium]